MRTSPRVISALSHRNMDSLTENRARRTELLLTTTKDFYWDKRRCGSGA